MSDENTNATEIEELDALDNNHIEEDNNTEKENPQKEDNNKTKKEKSYFQRLPLSFLFSFVFSFTVFFYIPYEFLALNTSSYNFSLSDATLPLIISSALIFIIVGFVLAIFKGLVYKIISTIVVWFTFCSYLQSTYLNNDFGIMDGEKIDWASITLPTILNTLLWLAILAILIILIFIIPKYTSPINIFICILVLVMQITGFVSLLVTQSTTGSTDADAGVSDNTQLTYAHINEFSKESNTIVFLIDRLDYRYLEDTLKVNPNLLDGLDGFTNYTNATSMFFRTIPGSNYALTNYTETLFKEPINDFLAHSWDNKGKHILKQLKNGNYSVNIYDTVSDMFGRTDDVKDQVDNFTTDGPEINHIQLLLNTHNITAFKYMPYLLKPIFWQYSGDLNEGVIDDMSVFDEKEETFATYIDKFKTTNDKCFKWYHFIGAHSPFRLKSDGSVSDTETTLEEQVQGSFTIIYKALDKLKEMGIYDKTSIIITADHPTLTDTGDQNDLSTPKRIAMFYKPANSTTKGLITSTMPVSQDNIPATILKSCDINYALYGIPLDEVTYENTKERYAYKTISSNGSYDEIEYIKYGIVNDASDFSNWRIIERKPIEYPCN